MTNVSPNWWYLATGLGVWWISTGNFLTFVSTLHQRVCDHQRVKVKDSKTSCPENRCEPDCERACHVPPRRWWHDVCIWSDSGMKQTDLPSPWHWRYSSAQGIWFTQNKSAAFVKFTSWLFVWQQHLPKVYKINTNSANVGYVAAVFAFS